MYIFTSYFGNLKHISQDIVPIAICRYKPRWYSGLWYKRLAPSEPLLKGIKGGEITQDEYTSEFNAYLNGLDKEQVLSELEAMSGGKDICLLCYEKPGDFCHRHLVWEWLMCGKKMLIEPELTTQSFMHAPVGLFMRDKIQNHYQENYASSPMTIDENDITMLIEHGCQCDHCEISIFEMDDAPSITHDNEINQMNEGTLVLCEECHDEAFRHIPCPICENIIDIRFEGLGDHFYLDEVDAKALEQPMGLYKILHRPFCGIYGLIEGQTEFLGEIDFKKAHQDYDKAYSGDDYVLCNLCTTKGLKLLNQSNI